MKVLAILLITVNASAHAFWDGNNPNFSPFGSGTGYNNIAPWGDNSNWNPFVSSGNWGPRNDAANLSRYGGRPQSLMQYRKDPRFQPHYPAFPAFQNTINPSNWLKETDFASTLLDMGEHNKDFFVDDNFSPIGLSNSYIRAKSESVGVNKMLRDRSSLSPYKNDATDNIYGKQGYGLSPAALSTNWMNE